MPNYVTNCVTPTLNAERGNQGDPGYRVPMRYMLAPPSRLERLTRSLGNCCSIL